MTEMNFKEIANQMKELEIKASKYDEIKENVDRVMEQVNEKISEIHILLSDISPMISLKRKYKKDESKGFGDTVIGYVEKFYNYLVESEAEMTIPDLEKNFNSYDEITGGTETKIRIALSKMHGIRSTPDNNDRRKILYSYDKSEGKLEMNIPDHIREVVKKKDVGELQVDDSDEKIKDQIPKKFSHMG